MFFGSLVMLNFIVVVNAKLLSLDSLHTRNRPVYMSQAQVVRFSRSTTWDAYILTLDQGYIETTCWDVGLVLSLYPFVGC